MNVFITAGTYDFLKKIEAKYPGEKMFTMNGAGGALLFHETQGKTVFKEPRRFEVIASSGELAKKAFAALYNIPSTSKDRPLLEDWLKKQTRNLAIEQGLTALRLLRPLSSHTFVLLTVWENESQYHLWKTSGSFFEAKKTSGLVNDPQSKIFAGEPYFSEYYISE